MNEENNNIDNNNINNEKDVNGNDYSRSNYSNSYGYGNFYTPYPEYPETNANGKNSKKSKKKEKKSGGVFKKLIVAILVGVLFGGSAAGAFYCVNEYILPKKNIEAPDTKVDELTKQVDDLAKLIEKAPDGSVSIASVVSTDVTAVAERVMPSMVSVTNQGVAVSSDWFGRQYTYDTQSAGSGIIIGENDTEYLIATNHHVIADSKTLTVLFVDEKTCDAYVKGYDATLDIAVIGVLKDNLEDSTKAAISVAELGNSDALKIGEPAIAIGNALGYGQSVTTGVVSAINREMTIDDMTYSSLIQTNAAINPGNSGGALLNVYGQVIGINSSKIASSTVEGMGFAIPISEVKDILKEFGDRETRVKLEDDARGYLGITGTQQDVTAFGYPEGAYVIAVTENGPAAQAGIYEGDVIVKVDGQSVLSLASLQELLSFYAPGEKVDVVVKRRENGQFVDKTLTVTLGKRPTE